MIEWDELSDVVSVYFPETKAASFGPSPHSGLMMLERGADGAVIGVELEGVSDVTLSAWREHPDRELVPQALFEELDNWLTARWAATVKKDQGGEGR